MNSNDVASVTRISLSGILFSRKLFSEQAVLWHFFSNIGDIAAEPGEPRRREISFHFSPLIDSIAYDFPRHIRIICLDSSLKLAF